MKYYKTQRKINEYSVVSIEVIIEHYLISLLIFNNLILLFNIIY